MRAYLLERGSVPYTQQCNVEALDSGVELTLCVLTQSRRGLVQNYTNKQYRLLLQKKHYRIWRRLVMLAKDKLFYKQVTQQHDGRKHSLTGKWWLVVKQASKGNSLSFAGRNNVIPGLVVCTEKTRAQIRDNVIPLM